MFNNPRNSTFGGMNVSHHKSRVDYGLIIFDCEQYSSFQINAFKIELLIRQEQSHEQTPIKLTFQTELYDIFKDFVYSNCAFNATVSLDLNQKQSYKLLNGVNHSMEYDVRYGHEKPIANVTMLFGMGGFETKPMCFACEAADLIIKGHRTEDMLTSTWLCEKHR